jgi:hypothetical protein
MHMNPHILYWFDGLKRIWETKKPEGIIALCADSFTWYETPFDEPITTREDLLNEWRGILKQEAISVQYEVESIYENVGLAHWHAAFTRLPGKEKVELDGIFKVVINTEGKCIEFRQWYNTNKPLV